MNQPLARHRSAAIWLGAILTVLVSGCGQTESSGQSARGSTVVAETTSPAVSEPSTATPATLDPITTADAPLSPTVEPSPQSGDSAAILPTQPAGNGAYGAAELTGRLVEVGACLRVSQFEGDPGPLVIWPHGFTTSREDGVLTVRNADGDLVARVGDTILMGGGWEPEQQFRYLRPVPVAGCWRPTWNAGQVDVPATIADAVLPTAVAEAVAPLDPEIIDLNVPETSTPAWLNSFGVPTDPAAALAIIDRLPEELDGWIRHPLPPGAGPGYNGWQYLRPGADAPSKSLLLYVWSIPESDPSFVNWTVDDQLAQDQPWAAIVPSEGGRDGELFWIEMRHEAGTVVDAGTVVAVGWGLAGSPILIQAVAPSEDELQLLLDALLEAERTELQR